MQKAALEGSTPRLVIVSSDSHFWIKIPEKATESPNILEAMNEESYFNTVYVF